MFILFFQFFNNLFCFSFTPSVPIYSGAERSNYRYKILY